MKINLRFHTGPRLTVQWLAAPKLAVLFLSASLLATNILPAQAQTPLQRSLVGTASSEPSGESAGPQASEQDLQELVRLLSNPALVQHLQQSLRGAADAQTDDEVSTSNLQRYFEEALILAEVRGHRIADALTTIPDLSRTLSDAWNENTEASSFLQSVIYVVIFLFGGFGLEWLYWSYLSPTLNWVEQSKPQTYGGVLKAAVLRAALLFGSTAVFAFGGIGLFVGFEWSAFIDDIVLSLLAGIIAMRFIIMLAVFVLAPKVDDLRLLPLDKTAAKNIYAWILAISGVGLLGYLCVDTLNRMAIAAPSLLAVESITGTLFVAVLISAIWLSEAMRRRGSAITVAVPGGGPDFGGPDFGGQVDGGGMGSGGTSGVLRRSPGNITPVLASALVVVAFLLWLLDADDVMWTLLTLALLAPAIRLSRIMVDHIFDHVDVQEPAVVEPDEEAGDEEAPHQPAPPSRYQLYRPIADSLIRFLLIIVAVLIIGMVWDIAAILQSTSNTLAEKVLGVIIDVVFALLIANLIWTLVKTSIEQKLASFPVPEAGHAPGPEARMATLLPMFKIVLMITIIIMAALIILSSLGINIGPILAGAGVIGIALGFGAQALVKDIVSGVFFLIDDAFRVGEYIEMGELRGTVESVSLRSLRVRHHRGALHTIPYGELKSLTNYSRDWVIMKLEFRVPFDTDVNLVKKIVKKVGANLLANPDYGHHILDPLKSQGVRRMEEFNMVVGVKFMAVPGEQWTIRRDTYQQVLNEFEKNGIHLAQRNVQVEVVSNRPLTKEEEEAATSAVQESVEPVGPPGPVPDEP